MNEFNSRHSSKDSPRSALKIKIKTKKKKKRKRIEKNNNKISQSQI